MICVEIDVEKGRHDCFIISSEGEVLAGVYTIPTTWSVQLPTTKNPTLLK